VNLQIPLTLRWPAHQRFDTFISGANVSALECVRHSVEQVGAPWVFLAGATGSGKTHLMIAACAAASAAGHRAQYVSLATLNASRATAVRNCSGSEFLAIDNIEAIAGDSAAEHALFDLYNRLWAEQTTVLFAGLLPPAQLGLTLPDLVSRLSACTQVVLKPLEENGRRDVLRHRAAARGLELDDTVLDWLFSRQARDLGTLTTLLERIDTAALVAQRRITVPFLRQVLGGEI